MRVQITTANKEEFPTDKQIKQFQSIWKKTLGTSWDGKWKKAKKAGNGVIFSKSGNSKGLTIYMSLDSFQLIDERVSSESLVVFDGIPLSRIFSGLPIELKKAQKNFQKQMDDQIKHMIPTAKLLGIK